MKESNYKNYDELPLFLNAAMVAKVLGIAPSSIRKCADSVWMKSKERTGELILKMRC